MRDVPASASVSPRRLLRSPGAALGLGALIGLGLGLRLLVWDWHEQYPLGGDEREYFEQALTWLQGKGYYELPLMRPPLYTVFLAGVFQLFDSQVQRVRLVQACISTTTIAFMWFWARELLGPSRTRAALITAGMTALCYTFAANASELLTETLFVAGLTLVFWLLLRSAPAPSVVARRPWAWAASAGLAVGILALVRSVALPLLPLGAVWLLLQNNDQRAKTKIRVTRFSALRSLFFVLCSLLVILPWTARNYRLYATPIVIDTTGAENLWLDNDPAGREAVKRQLYALGDDRGARQRLAMRQGLAVITADPARFVGKAWAETKKFMALEYFDDLRQRRAIWVPPLEVWLRLLLGDGIWLLVLLGGLAGLWLGPNDWAKLLLVPWVLYVLLTGLVFHVELRYRLPLYPALLPYAGWSILGLSRLFRGKVRDLFPLWPRMVGAALSIAAALLVLLLHRDYPAEAVMLARKHYHLAAARRASSGDPAALTAARRHAEAVLQLDPRSALARVELGLVADEVVAQKWWRAAIDTLPAHPYAHLLLGNSLRQAGQLEAARQELAFETHSLEDLQHWSLQMFRRAPEGRVDIGDGLDLGTLTGFYPATHGTRWTSATAEVHKLAPGSAISLHARSPRPPNAAPALVRVLANGVSVGTLKVGAEWQTFTVPLPEHLQAPAKPLTVRLESATFRQRDFDRASDDNRRLGIEIDWVTTHERATAP